MLAEVQKILPELTDKSYLCVAYSGGVDSHVLLHLLAQLTSYQVRAVYIHHGLSEAADHWQVHCKKVCAALDISFSALAVNVQLKKGFSLEAEARQLRYQALFTQLNNDEVLLTAHNADDQAETFLLQLFRGAGIDGLSAMPQKKISDQGELLRPLLTISRADIESYAKSHQLKWVEDHSNQDEKFDRNYVRHQILTQIKNRWPGILTTLQRSTENLADAKHIVRELAAADLINCLSEKKQLSITSLRKYSTRRQYQILRCWIIQSGYELPSKKILLEMFKHVIAAKEDAMPCVEWAGQQLRRYHSCLYLTRLSQWHASEQRIPWDLQTPIALPEHLGTLYCEASQGLGLSPQLRGQACEVRFRQGGERIKPAGRHETHELKALLQQWQVPPWLRSRIPLIYYENQLICVVGYCIASHVASESNGLTIGVKD